MNTVGSIIKLLTITTESKEEKTIPGLFDIWKNKSGFSSRISAESNTAVGVYSLSDIIKTLPSFTTTSTGETDAVMQIKTEDHGILKNSYEKVFPSEWEKKKVN